MPRPFVPYADLDILESPEEVLSTLRRDGSRRWLYPVPAEGRWLRRRRLVGWALIALFVALPIARIGGKPAVLLDVAAREFTFFGFTFYPTDTLLLLLFLLSALVAVFLLTALWGRVWCGWGCPQTVYLEFVYRPIERLIEGPEHVRQRRDAGPPSWDRTRRRALKLAAFALVSLALAHVFVAYFAGWDRLLVWMTGPPSEHWGYFLLMAGTTALVLYDFGYFREQMCTIACPYARFQSVLTDPDSLIVSYDPARGEPRGRGKKRDGLGDCVDCLACVRTCPTGIDIRDGLQMECIACTQCIDACDAIMNRVGRPRGLIRYTSERELAGGRSRLLRSRTALYAGLLLALTTAFTVAATTRHAYDVNVGRTAGPPFVEMPDGSIANRLRFRVRNQTARATAFTVAAEAPAGLEVRLVGVPPVALGPREMRRVEAFVLAPRALFAGRDEVEAVFVLRFADGAEERVTFPLLGPAAR